MNNIHAHFPVLSILSPLQWPLLFFSYRFGNGERFKVSVQSLGRWGNESAWGTTAPIFYFFAPPSPLKEPLGRRELSIPSSRDVCLLLGFGIEKIFYSHPVAKMPNKINGNPRDCQFFLLLLNSQNDVKNRALSIHSQKCIKYFKIPHQTGQNKGKNLGDSFCIRETSE